MDRRLKLQKILEQLLGSRNVYYQPPEGLKMEYPCIRYYKQKIDKKSANNKAYLLNDCYELVIIDTKPDNPIIAKLLDMETCSFNRSYDADNLKHTILTLYY